MGESLTLFDRIADVVAERLNVPRETIRLDSAFDDFGADSLDMVDVILAVETECKTKLNKQEALGMITMRDLLVAASRGAQ